MYVYFRDLGRSFKDGSGTNPNNPEQGKRDMQRVDQLIAATLAILISMLVLSGTWGYFASFVPSPLTVTITIWSASVLGLFSAAFYCGSDAFGSFMRQQAGPAGKPARRRSVVPENRYLRGLFMGFGVFGLTWLSLGSGLPLLLTNLFGHSGEMTAVVDGWTPRSGRSCLHPTLLHVPPLVMNEHSLCTDEGVKATMPPGTSIGITGRVSILGVVPDAIRRSPTQ